MPQVPVAQMAEDLPADEILALGALKLEIFLWTDMLPHFGHTTSFHDSLLRINSSNI